MVCVKEFVNKNEMKESNLENPIEDDTLVENENIQVDDTLEDIVDILLDDCLPDGMKE